MKYRIKDWDKHYENAKSRTIEHKAWCPVPNKQDGLGYRRMLAEKDGSAIYGAFVAVILMASKQSLPREGYLTDTGRIDGIPHTPEALSLKTGIPSAIIEKMLNLCCSQAVGWVEVVDASTPQGYCEDTTSPGGIRLKEGREGEEGEDISPFRKTNHMLIIESWFNRRESTQWSAKELKALPKEIHPDDLKVLDKYYKYPFLPDKDYRRRDLQTLLSNWLGEVDRARKWDCSKSTDNRVNKI